MAPSCLLSALISLIALSPASSSPTPSDAPDPFFQPQETHPFAFLAPILTNLGFQELAMAVPALYSPVLSSWSGPITLFAPSDESIGTCPSCSTPRLLREHLVPGLFSSVYLSKLAFGTKLETASTGYCLTITKRSTTIDDGNPSDVKIFVNSVEITRPDIFNNGRIIIHGIQGFIAPLTPASCSQEPRAQFPSEIPFERAGGRANHPASALMRLFLRDAILRLRSGGYSILSLAMRVKYAELVRLQNMTVFALDDRAIFSGGHGYLKDVRFHVVPNQVLLNADLMKLPEGTLLPTLVPGQRLVVRQTNYGPFSRSVRINYVPIKSADVIYNAKIVVHSIFLPFPHLYLENLAISSEFGRVEGWGWTAIESRLSASP